MKLNLHETHDRYESFTKKNDFDIGECCQNLIDKRPFGHHAFYIFAHARTLGIDERMKLFSSGTYKTFEEVPEKTIIWQPRLRKPEAQTNSMLFKAYPGTDLIKTIWIIPDDMMWSQYEEGKITHNETILNSIRDFKNNKEKLELPEDGDLSDEQIKAVYDSISKAANHENRMKGIRKRLII